MGVSEEKQKQPRKRWLLKSGNPGLDLRTLPRCQAKAKSSGKRCGNPAMKGKRVCYLHGGKSPGAPKGNKNALKTGRYTAEALQERRMIKSILRESQKLFRKIDESI